MFQVKTIKCTSVVAQVNLGFYDEEGNLVGEEMYPQADGNNTIARFFHPFAEHLAILIDTCVEQAWAKVGGQTEPAATAAQLDGGRRDRIGV